MEPQNRYEYMTQRFFGTMRSCFEQTDEHSRDRWKVVYSDTTDAPEHTVSVFVVYRRETE